MKTIRRRRKLSLSFLSKSWKPLAQLPSWLRQSLPISDQIRKLRGILGMTQNQLANRAHTTQQAIAMTEAGKVDLRLSTLKRIAEAMECECLIQLVPRQEIEKLRHEQALKKARLLVGLSAGSTALELQMPPKEFVDKKIKEVAQHLLENKGHKLWE